MSATGQERWRVVDTGDHALSFDGDDDDVSVPTAAMSGLGDEGSWAVWVRVEDHSALDGADLRIFNSRDSGGLLSEFRSFGPTRYSWTVANGSSTKPMRAYYISGDPEETTPPDGEWHLVHYRWQPDGSDTLLEAGHNGTWYHTDTISGTLVMPDTSVSIGTWRGDYFPGDLDEFVLYDRAITDAETETLHDSRGSPPTSGLVVHYDMDEGSGSTLTDNAGTNDGTINGASYEYAAADEDLYDVTAVEAVNRYASHFEATFDDPFGTKADEYPRGTRRLLQYSDDGGSTWNDKQGGFVQKRTDSGEVGLFEALFVGYDHLLRREPVYTTFSSVTVSSALSTLIQNHTPVTYNASKVEVVEDATITREFNGEVADEVLSWLASVSGGEEFGVDSDFEFFFRPAETESAPGNVLAGDWHDYDLPDEGRHAVNTVRVFYGASGSRSSVIVEDRVEQRDLKDQLDAARRVVLGRDVHYPEISNRDAARAKGEEILNQRSPVTTGTVSTIKRYGWEPGQVFLLEVPEKGIEDSYRVAEVAHSWLDAETDIKVASNTGNVQDLLMQMSDDITRVDLRNADPTATYTRYLDLDLGVTVSITASATQTATGDTAFVAGFTSQGDVAGFTRTEDGEPQPGFEYNLADTSGGTGAATTVALQQFRDVWQGTAGDTVDSFKVGTGTVGAVQTDTDLQAAVGGLQSADSVAASGSYSITFEATLSPGGTVSGTDITEFGFFESGGDMHNRATLDEAVTHGAATTTSLSMTFTVDTDATKQGVVTDTGQTRLRDMYLGDVAVGSYYASDRAYGTGSPAVVESASALGSKVGEASLTHTDAGTTSDGSSMELDTSTANGNTLTEFGDENPNNELLTLATFEGLAKTSDFNLVSDNTFTVRPITL